MSSIYLLLGLVGTFGAVLMTGYAVRLSGGERRRTVRLLESQVGHITNLRERELSTRPFKERVAGPLLSGVGHLTRRLTPLGLHSRLTRKLVLAGSPAGWDAERLATMKMLGAGAGFILMLVLVNLAGVSGLLRLVMLIAGPTIGYLAPESIVSSKAEERQKAIRRALPDTMDLLTISVEAGLGMDAALAQVTEHVPGPLAEEITRLLQEMQLGVSRADAFRHLADRTDSEDLSGFVLAMVQAEIFGVSIAQVLRAQSEHLRIRRRQLAEEAAMKVPVKILMPLMLCILPVLFIVILGPGLIRISEAFSSKV